MSIPKVKKKVKSANFRKSKKVNLPRSDLFRHVFDFFCPIFLLLIFFLTFFSTFLDYFRHFFWLFLTPLIRQGELWLFFTLFVYFFELWSMVDFFWLFFESFLTFQFDFFLTLTFPFDFFFGDFFLITDSGLTIWKFFITVDVMGGLFSRLQRAECSVEEACLGWIAKDGSSL